jgi:hypothetical protein
LEDDEGKPYFLPALDGKQGGIAQQAMGYMHVVGHGIKRTVKDEKSEKPITLRRVYFQSSGPYKAKDRYDALGRWIDNPTLPQIERMINRDTVRAATSVRVEHEDIVDAEVVEDEPKELQPANAGPSPTIEDF